MSVINYDSVIMSDNIYLLVNEILKDRQLSISGVTRELKDKGIDEHRLVMTGYLRALKDLRILNEVDIPPSKVYSLVEVEQKDNGDIYSLIAENIKSVDSADVVPIVVYILSKILDRPVFKEEIIKAGVSSKNLSDHLASSDCAIRSVEKSSKDYTSGITKLKIPAGEPVYEVGALSDDVIKYSSCVLIKVVRNSVDLSGLIPKTKTTSITDFG